MSPAFIYNLINDGVDSGSYIGGAINLIRGVGICSLAKMPYNAADYRSWPSEQAWREAAFYRGSNDTVNIMSLQNDAELGNVKNWIASGNLAIISIDAYKIQDKTWGWSLLTNNDMLTLDNYNNPQANHAVTIVGYNNNFSYTEQGQTRYGAFKIANSWGIPSLPSPFSWEHILDGYFWISYAAMKQQINYCNVFTDKTNYNPELLATFRINHAKRSDCTVVIGLGTPTRTITSKNFNDYVSGGAYPFCSNKIVLDISEFKEAMPAFYNQPFYLKVSDGGTSTTGTITYFAIGNTTAPGTPLLTRQGQSVYLSLNYSSAPTIFTVSPTSGPSGGLVTLDGLGFTANSSANLSYLNPVTSTWIPLINNVQTNSSYQFTYSFNVPDLMQSNPTGDNSQISDSIIFKAIDNGNGFSCITSVPYTEWRRGLTRIGNANATGVFGNNTDLTSTVFVQAGEVFAVSGKWFSPGDLAFLYDGTLSLGSAVADGNGAFNANLILPTSAGAGTHNITVNDANTNFVFYAARLPIISADYDGYWHSSDYTINLQCDGTGVSQIYYHINGASTKSVNVNGQPLITTEGDSNTLEYWGIWSNGLANIELPHRTLTGVKLDKTMPEGSIQINNGSASTPSTLVTLSITTTDSLSGIHQIRFSNDGIWDTEQWETPTSSKNWLLTDGNGVKTVYFQIQDNAGLLSTVNSSILLAVVQPMSHPTTEPSNNPSVIPEYTTLTIIILIITATVTLLTLTYTRKNVRNKKF